MNPLSGLVALVLLSIALALPTRSWGQVAMRYERGWPVVSCRGRDLSGPRPEPAASVTVSGQALPSSPRPTATGNLNTSYETSTGLLTDTLEPFPGLPNCWVRRLTFTNRAAETVDLVGADLRLAPLAPEGAREWAARAFHMIESAPGGPTLCTAFTSAEDWYHLQVGPAILPGPAVTHHSQAAWRLPPGGTATIGSQYLWLVDGPLATARASTARWFEALDLRVADGGPDWLRDCVMYQACAGGSVDSMFGDSGGFDAFARQLDYLADLGVNAFWLMSVMTHKDPASPRTGWNLYGPLSYDQIDPAYGGEAGLTRLMAAMRERDFRVLGELVPHGGYTPLTTSHPEWWTYQQDGKRNEGFGQAMDYSAPGWQAEMQRAARWLSGKWGLEGYRIDVACGFGVNWSSPTNGPHVSLSTQAGSLGMIRAIRQGALEGGIKAPVMVPEMTPVPEAAPYGQVGYMEIAALFEEARHLAGDPPAMADHLRKGLDNDQGSMPPGTILWRSLNNHDHVVEAGRADRRWGVGLQRALTGVCAVIDGVPIIYQEQEVGSYSYFRRLFWARRRVPEMRRGAADYRGVQAPPGVFAVLRSLQGSHAVGLVNLSWQPVAGEVRLPPGLRLPASVKAHDAVSGLSATVSRERFRWRLEPYATAMLSLGKASEGGVPPERHRAQSVSAVPARETFRWLPDGPSGRFEGAGLAGAVTSPEAAFSATMAPDGALHLTATGEPGKGELALRLQGVDRWFVESLTGQYEDRLMRRHYPWPEGLFRWDPSLVWGFEPYHLYRGSLPAGRQWQSAVAPLRPGGRLGFAAPGGDGLVVKVAASNAMNAVLTDWSELPDPEPYGLTLRFLANDGALNPRWTPGYRRSVWTEFPTEFAPSADKPFRVRLTIAAQADVAGAFAVDRPRLADGIAHREVGPGQHHDSVGALWLVEPNTVTWRDAGVREAGDYDLWMCLRHSEIAADRTELTEHYGVSLDGRPVSFEWTQLAIWTYGNSYWGWARAHVGELAAGPHTLAIRTGKSWCAIRHQSFYLSRDPAFRPTL